MFCLPFPQQLTACLAIGLLLCSCQRAAAFSYSFAGEANGVDVVAHAGGYDGTGGAFNITVGIDTTSVNKTDMVISVKNAIKTWNDLIPTTGNLLFGGANNIPSGQVDFESTLLHELGHSLGLGHNNLGFRDPDGSGPMPPTVSGPDTNYAASTDGADNTFDFGAGSDGVIGTADDIRGDDINLNYFRTAAGSMNDPFSIDSTVDSTTYSRDLDDLTNGDNYSAVAGRDTYEAIFGPADHTEAVMNQGAFSDEDQRALAHDDVAGIRYAQSGLDSTAGTGDDYSWTLTFAGFVDAGDADIVIDFDSSETSFAVSRSSGTFRSSNDIAITDSDIYFNTNPNWFFNDVPTVVPEPSGLVALLCLGTAAAVRRRRRSH